MSSDINYLANSLKRLFEEDTDEYVPFTSGRYDVMRGSIGKTAKVFNKKRVPADRADMAVLLAVDNSGSMNDFNNIQNAVCAAFVIAEACENPCLHYGIYERAKTVCALEALKRTAFKPHKNAGNGRHR